METKKRRTKTWTSVKRATSVWAVLLSLLVTNDSGSEIMDLSLLIALTVTIGTFRLEYEYEIEYEYECLLSNQSPPLNPNPPLLLTSRSGDCRNKIDVTSDHLKHANRIWKVVELKSKGPSWLVHRGNQKPDNKKTYLELHIELLVKLRVIWVVMHSCLWLFKQNSKAILIDLIWHQWQDVFSSSAKEQCLLGNYAKNSTLLFSRTLCTFYRRNSSLIFPGNFIFKLKSLISSRYFTTYKYACLFATVFHNFFFF